MRSTTASVAFSLVFISHFLTSEGLFRWATHFGKCPENLSVQQNFNVTAYEGDWFEQAGYYADIMLHHKIRCATTNYYFDWDLMHFNVDRKWIKHRKNKPGSFWTTAKQTNPEEHTGKFVETYKKKHYPIITGPYWILSTDYTTYSIGWYCENFAKYFHFYGIWILSRNQTFQSDDEEKAFFDKTYGILKTQKINTKVLKRTSQLNCTYSLQ